MRDIKRIAQRWLEKCNGRRDRRSVPSISGLNPAKRDRGKSATNSEDRVAESAKAADALQVSRDQTSTETAGREALEAQVHQLQKMEAVGQLTAGIAHDFNNMNAVVISAISLIRRKLSKGHTDIGALLDAATDGAERSAKLTARLMAFARQQQLSPQSLDPSKFIGGLTELLRRSLGENIRIETVLGGGLWRVYADSSQLENAILNLSVNARDAMPNGGRLTLETANVSLDDAYSRSNIGVTAGEYVMIAVSDSGEGMTPEVTARAFEPFFTMIRSPTLPHLRLEIPASMIRSPTLPHLRLEIPASRCLVGLVATGRLSSAIGAWLPIAPCGLTSL